MQTPIVVAVLSLIIPRLSVTQDLYHDQRSASIAQERSQISLIETGPSAEQYNWYHHQGSPPVIGVDEHPARPERLRLVARKMSKITKWGFRKFLKAAFTINLVNPLECSNLATVKSKSKFKQAGMRAIGFESSQSLCLIQLEMLTEGLLRRAF